MLKKFKQFVNENDSSYIDWAGIEELCANTPGLPDSVPQNVRQWDTFIKQYERACDLVSGKWEPHYNWETHEEFIKAVNEQFYLGKGFKYSIYEFHNDFAGGAYTDFIFDETLFENIDWIIIEIAKRFTHWHIVLEYCNLTEFPLLPKKIGGDFLGANNKLTSLKGCPEHVDGSFDCDNNPFLMSLKDGPKYVGQFFYCPRQLAFAKSIPKDFPGKDLHKYIDK